MAAYQTILDLSLLAFVQAAELGDMSKADLLNEPDISGIDLIDYDASELSEELARFQL
jgi:hypothetical protein